MTSDEQHGWDLGSRLATRSASVLRDWRQVIRVTFPSHGPHRLAGKGRRKCSQIGRVRSGQYLVAWRRGCSCCSCGGGFCLGWDLGTLSAETGCPSTVYAWPSLGKALFSESVIAPSKEYKVTPNVTPYVTNSEWGLKLYSDVPRGGSLPLHSLGTAQCGAEGRKCRSVPSSNCYHTALLPDVPSDPVERCDGKRHRARRRRLS